MGWKKQDNGRPRIYNYGIVQGGTYAYHEYTDPTPQWFTWQRGNLWAKKEQAALYEVDSKPMRISSIKLKIHACHSGGKSYYAYGGWCPAVSGVGANYLLYLRIWHKASNSWEECGLTGTQQVSAITSSNMIFQGGPGKGTAVFDDTNSYATRTFEFANSPTLLPGDKAYVHLKVTFNSASDQQNATIRFIMDPQEMEVKTEDPVTDYIWRYNGTKWVLVRPLKAFKNNAWVDVKDGDGA